MVAWSNICSTLHADILEKSSKTLCLCIHGLSDSLLTGQVTPKLPCVSFCAGRHSLQYQVAQSTQVGDSFAIVIHLSQPMLSNDLLIASVVGASLSIEVSHNDGKVLSWAVLLDSRQSAVELFFYILISVICWGITLDDSPVDLPFFGLWPLESLVHVPPIQWVLS